MSIKMFTMQGCPPCKQMKENVLPELSFEVDLIDIDTDEGRELAMKYRVRSVPTVVLLDDEGNVEKMFVGYKSTKQFEEFLEG